MFRKQAKQKAAAVEAAQLLGLTRAGIGATLFLAPGLSARAWLGEQPSSRSKLVMRALGAREVVIGLGLLIALEKKAQPKTWLEAGAMCDAADTLLVLGAGAVPPVQRLVSIVSTAAAAVRGAQLADELD